MNRRALLQQIVDSEKLKPDRVVDFKPSARLINELGYKNIVELGVRDGKHFEKFANSDADVIVGCDLWIDSDNVYENDKKFTQHEQDDMYSSLRNKYLNDSRVKIIKHDSSTLSKEYDDGYFDLVFIDADHSYEGVKKDINAWYNKVRDGGIVSGHDYEQSGVTVDGNYYEFGVMKAVDEFVKDNNLKDKLYITPKKGNWGGGIPCWYILK